MLKSLIARCARGHRICDMRASFACTARSSDHLENNLREINGDMMLRMNEADHVKRARLQYQSRKRGILETGIILGSFFSKHYASLTEGQLNRYELLLNEMDWDIYYWITGRNQAPSIHETDVIAMIRNHVKESRGFANQQDTPTVSNLPSYEPDESSHKEAKKNEDKAKEQANRIDIAPKSTIASVIGSDVSKPRTKLPKYKASEISTILLSDVGSVYNPTIDQKKFAKKFFTTSNKFLKSATRIDEFPNADIPEIAFLGRSNVGKSSLLNSLTANASLAKTSSKPGQTKTMNLFSINNSLILVDLPGYGYRSQQEWFENIGEYMSNRRNLRRVCLLIDSMHGVKQNDLEAIKLLSLSTSFLIVLTKCDRITGDLKSTIQKISSCIDRETDSCLLIPIATSSKTMEGIDQLRHCLLSACSLEEKLK